MSVLLGDKLSMFSDLKITKRKRPHWIKEGSVYFVTFRTLMGGMSEDERQIVLTHILEGHAVFYLLIVAVVMMDHVHLVFRPYDDYSLSRVMKGIKGVSSRLINDARKTRGAFWKDESYDRIIRNDKELIQKIQYVLCNPVRAGIVEEPFDYEFLYYNERWKEELRLLG